MKIPGQTSLPSQKGFSLIELVIVCAILTIVLGAVFNGIDLATQRSQAEQTKVDLTQEGREFIDEFERDLHQAGYPNCRMVSTAGVANNCPADNTSPAVAMNPAVAVGLVSVSNTQVVFEGDVDGDGVVDVVVYRLVDAAGNYPPATTCPCTVQRSQMPKVNGILPLAQPTTFSQELQNVVNSGVVACDQAMWLLTTMWVGASASRRPARAPPAGPVKPATADLLSFSPERESPAVVVARLRPRCNSSIRATNLRF